MDRTDLRKTIYSRGALAALWAALALMVSGCHGDAASGNLNAGGEFTGEEPVVGAVLGETNDTEGAGGSSGDEETQANEGSPADGETALVRARARYQSLRRRWVLQRHWIRKTDRQIRRAQRMGKRGRIHRIAATKFRTFGIEEDQVRLKAEHSFTEWRPFYLWVARQQARMDRHEQNAHRLRGRLHHLRYKIKRLKRLDQPQPRTQQQPQPRAQQSEGL